jgi:predicted aspartyl protease
VKSKARYSSGYDPPAPVIPVRVSAPGAGSGLGLSGLLDTGADLTLIPLSAAAGLGLPALSTTRVVGVAGAGAVQTVHAAAIDIAGTTVLAEVVAMGDEMILGRDVLNRFVLHLDGPRQLLEVRRPRPKPRAIKRRPVKSSR